MEKNGLTQKVIEELKKKAAEIRQQKVDVVKKQNYEQAAQLRDKEKKLVSKLSAQQLDALKNRVDYYCKLDSPQNITFKKSIKDLKIKGSSSVVKVGTKVKTIRLVPDASDGHNIDCKIDGIGQMKLKSEFVKKA